MNSDKNNPLSYLVVAGGTLLFYMFVLPVADTLSNYIQQVISNKIAKLQYIMVQDQQEIKEISDKINDYKCANTIGFQTPSKSCKDECNDE